jgi:hypothetical protein
MKTRTRLLGTGVALACGLLVLGSMPEDAWADRGGGGRSVQGAGPSSVRSGNANANRNANANVNRNANVNQNANVNRNANVNQNTNVNRNTNVNVNSNTNVNVHHDYDNDWDNGGAFIAGAVVGGITGAAIASSNQTTVITTLPSGCATVIINGISSYNCGGVYYQPQYSGSSVTYVIISP